MKLLSGLLGAASTNPWWLLFKKLWWVVPVLGLTFWALALKGEIAAKELSAQQVKNQLTQAQSDRDAAISTRDQAIAEAKGMEKANRLMADLLNSAADNAAKNLAAITKLEKANATVQKRISEIATDECFDKPLPPDALRLLDESSSESGSSGQERARSGSDSAESEP